MAGVNLEQKNGLIFSQLTTKGLVVVPEPVPATGGGRKIKLFVLSLMVFHLSTDSWHTLNRLLQLQLSKRAPVRQSNNWVM